MADFEFDLFVIGGGSGGVRAARVASTKGVSVGLAESYRYGGTCVIRGCVPKKLMVFASGFAEQIETARSFGWQVEKPSFNWEQLMLAKTTEIDRLEGVYKNLLDGTGVKRFNAFARLIGPNDLTLSTGETIHAKTILIATGGMPFVPEFEGSKHVITSNEVFDLKTQPKRIAIVGGGYIACEFAGIFNGLGSSVTQLYRGEKILRGFDFDVQTEVSKGMIEKGVDLRLNTVVHKIVKQKNGLSITLGSGDVIEVDEVLYATGRMPMVANMGLEKAGVELGLKDEILVDSYSKTNIDSIYAVGDVTDRAALTPVAIHEGMAFVATVFDGVPTIPDHTLIPTAVFTHPEIGTVGLTEADARQALDIDVYYTRFRPMLHSMAKREHFTMMKLIVEKENDRVLGCHIVGDGAGEMIQLVGIAVKMGATKADFDATMAVHPTSAEELVTMSTPRSD